MFAQRAEVATGVLYGKYTVSPVKNDVRANYGGYFNGRQKNMSAVEQGLAYTEHALLPPSGVNRCQHIIPKQHW